MNTEDLSYRLQGMAARLLMLFFRILPLDAASWTGGWLARTLGPLSSAHKTATKNLALAMPELSASARAKIISGMWDNIGRTTAEYPHLSKLIDDPQRVEVIDPGNLAVQIRDDGIGALMIGMHYGNWELATVPGHRTGFTQYHFYRAPNNPYVDALLNELRKPLQQEGFLPKGSDGARQAVVLLKKHAHIGMLVDQKQDEGIPALFFGREAMTTTAPAALARRLDVPVVAARVVRQHGAYFKIFVHEFQIAKTEDRLADVIVSTKQFNTLLEGWVREHPEQWFWVHKRWPR
ncbi:MAG TPA: lauroyl acyltransferase [Acidocella sp.]|nr:lauroyl acyltransferase [Acidocella sp.]